MKAKEYADRYLKDPSDITLWGVGKDIWDETKALIKSRHAQTDAALWSILNEQDRKWRAFARLVKDINPDGYRLLIQKYMPVIHDAWMVNKHFRKAILPLPSPEGGER